MHSAIQACAGCTPFQSTSSMHVLLYPDQRSGAIRMLHQDPGLSSFLQVSMIWPLSTSPQALLTLASPACVLGRDLCKALPPSGLVTLACPACVPRHDWHKTCASPTLHKGLTTWWASSLTLRVTLATEGASTVSLCKTLASGPRH